MLMAPLLETEEKVLQTHALELIVTGKVTPQGVRKVNMEENPTA